MAAQPPLGGGSPSSLDRTLDLLLTMGDDAQRSDPVRATECFTQAADLARTLGRPIDEARAQVQIGAIQTRLGRYADAEAALDRASALTLTAPGDLHRAPVLTALGQLRSRQGRTEEAFALLRESLLRTTEADLRGPAGSARAATLETLGTLYRESGDTSQALRCFQDALELRRAAGDEAGIATDLNHLGNLEHRLGRLEAAEAYLRDALERRRGTDDQSGAAATANNLAATLLQLGRFDEARSLLEESRASFERLGEKGRVANVLSNLGLIAVTQGRVTDAEHHFRESLRLQREIQDPAGQSNSLNNLSLLEVVRGNPLQVEELALESLRLRREAGLERGRSRPLHNLVQAYLELERLDDAARFAEEELEAARKGESIEEIARGLAHQALAWQLLGRTDEGLALAVEAMDLAERTEQAQLRANCGHALGHLHLERGDLEEAKRSFARASRLLRGAEHPFERAQLFLDEGRLLAAAGSFEGANERLHRAAEEFARLGNHRGQLRAAWELAHAAGALDPSRAAAFRQQVNELAEREGLQELLLNLARRGGLPGAAGREIDLLPRGLDRLARTLLDAARARSCDPTPILESIWLHAQREHGARALRLRWDVAATQRWRQLLGEEPTGSFRAGTERGTVELVAETADLAALPTTQRDTLLWLECELGTSMHPMGRLALAREAAVPASARERHALELAGVLLSLALEALLERAERRDAPHVVMSESSGAPFEGLVGRSRVLREVIQLLEQVAPTDANVLLLGESGTGKDVAARAIHARSRRAQGPFVPVNCPSIPRDLIESELFGHEKGAFTGAVAERPGKVELADGGTLFLDEVGDMSPNAQVKLLRFLQDREFERVGGRKARRADVRVLAATSRDLARAIERGEFREDLFYRLNVVPVRMPALRERVEDIPLLIAHLLQLLTHGSGRQVRLSAGALERLVAHAWPGNVRELRNVLEYMVTVSRGDVLDVSSLPQALAATTPRPQDRGSHAGARGDTLDHPLDAIEREAIESPFRPGETLEARLIEVEVSILRQALELERWNQSAAARRLGITESMIRNRMRQYSIEPPRERRPRGRPMRRSVRR